MLYIFPRSGKFFNLILYIQLDKSSIYIPHIRKKEHVTFLHHLKNICHISHIYIILLFMCKYFNYVATAPPPPLLI